MADDDEDVLGAPGREDLFGPPGLRRSNFTPAPTSVESLEAANSVFGDDAIAAAMAAEFARVTSGPIPVQLPAPSAEANPEPAPAVAAPAQEPAPVVPDPEPMPAPYVPESAPAPPVPEPAPYVPAPSPYVPEPEPAPAPFIPEPAPAQLVPESMPVAPEPDLPTAVEPEPIEAQAPPMAAEAPTGPPDWASSLFGQPNPPAANEGAAPARDPFAPSEPSFAPSSGPFPPPGEADAAGTSLTTDAEALRALYRGAPAPTVPPADAPPPPGYESAVPQEPQTPDSQTPSVDHIGELQRQLHLQEQEAREFAAWESSMLAIGTPEALAEVSRARQELASAPTPATVPEAPVSQPTPQFAPSQFAPPAETVPPFPTLEPPTSEFAEAEVPPTNFAPAEMEQPSFAPTSFAPTEAAPAEAAQTEAAQTESAPAGVLPPEPAPSVFAPTSFAPTQPAPTDFAPVEPVVPDSAAQESAAQEPERSDFATMEAVPEWGVQQPAPEPEWEFPAGPPVDSPFPGFAPPTSEEPAPMFEAPADPRDLSFDQTAVIPDAPVFIAPPALVEPAEPAVRDGVADLYRSAGEFAPPAEPVQEPPTEAEPPLVRPSLWEVAKAETAAPQSPVSDASLPDASIPEAPISEAPISEAPVSEAPVQEPLRPLNPLVPPPAAQSVAPPAPPPVTFGGFEISPDGAHESALPAPVWSAPEPAPDAEPESPKGDDEPGGHRPFGEGVERDDAVDPSDSIFGTAALSVSVNTAGVAVVAEPVSSESRPVRLIVPEPSEPPEPMAPPVFPAEPVGLEPTPLDQRVGRSARLFWLWFAANSSIVAIVFGTIIFALGVSLRQAIVATLAGVALSFFPLGLGTLAGKRSGAPTMVTSRASFGVVGNILPSLIALFSRLLWAAALLWILGGAVADILTGAKLADGFTDQQLTLIVMALGFLIAVALAYFGYALISIVQLVISIISGLAIVGFIALTVQYVDVQKALTTGDGPWILVVTGAVLVFSFVGIAWANSGADVARYQRTGSRGSAAMLWATFGVGLPTFVLICYGALLAASNPMLAHNIELDPLDSLGRLLPVWYPVPLLVATGLSLLSGVVIAMYSGGFALQAAGLRMKRSLATLLVGILVVLIAAFLALTVTDYAQLVRDLATTVAVPVAAWAGIFGSELMIRNRRFHAQSLLARGGVYSDARWGNLVALLASSVIGLGFLSATLPGLTWEGYLLPPLGIPLGSVTAQSDFGVLVAFGLGILFPLVAGIPAIRKQEALEATPE